MAIVRSKVDIPLNPSGVTFKLDRTIAMENHKKIIQHSKSAVHNVLSKVSKTSDSISARAEKRKTCSHAEVPQKPMKKRGVYVEKKAGARVSRPDMHVSPLIQAYMAHTGRGHHHRRSPQPKRRNTFISNVLSVLSKSTASTQYPPITDTAAKGHLLPMALKRNVSVDTNDAAQATKAKARELVEKIVHKHKKHRYRGGHKRRSPRPLVVLKSKKNLLQTPSNDTQAEPSRTNVRKSRHKKRRESVKKELQRSIYNEHESRIANAVLEGQEYKTTRRKLVDDQPVTLVSTMDQPEDKGLYKLFMDLLETTFSVYNVNTISRNPPLGYQRSQHDRRQNKPQSYMVTDAQASYYPHYASYLPKPLKKAPPKPKLKPCLKGKVMRDSPSQYYVRSIRKQLTEPRAPPEESKRGKKYKKTPKHKKETLLGLLRHELDMETHKAGPPNLYQALRVIARNKMRRHRLTRFSDTRKPDPSPSPDRCTLRRKNILATKKNPVLNKRSFQQLREQLESRMRVDDSEDEIVVPQIEDVSSYRTLEVLSYDRKGRVSGKRRDDSDDSVSWGSAHEIT